MGKSNRKSYFGMGAVSLAAALLILAIASFAVLTYVSADTEYKLSQQSKLATDQYYQADAAANRVLTRISQAMKKGNLQDISAKKGYNVTVEADKTIVTYKIAINPSKNLEVKAAFSSPNQVEILKWQVTIPS